MSTSKVGRRLLCFFWVGLFCVVGCATVQPTERHIALSAWLGLYYLEVLHQLGPPLDVFSDGASGRVLVYPEVTYPPTSRDAISADSLEAYDAIVWYSALDRYPPTYIEETYDMLFIDKDGRVYSFQSNDSDRAVRLAYERELIVGGMIGSVVLLGVLIVGAVQASSGN